MLTIAPQHQFLAFGDQVALDAGPGPADNLRPVVVKQSVSATQAAAADGYRSLRDMLRLSRAVAREDVDVFFSPSVYSYFPLFPGQRAVVTIHDAIAERFPKLTLPNWRARTFWNLKVRLALRQATLVLTVSEYAACEIESVHGVSRNRLRVALEAPEETYHPATASEVEEVRTASGIPQGTSWFTYVGGFSPHKRLDVVLKAHAALVAAQPEESVHLVLAGRREGDVFLSNGTTLEALAAELGTTALIHWTGFLSDKVLRALHTGAVACLLPSESEGFGLPAVEAAACGAPVIATTESPLPDLLAGGGIFVHPGDVDGLAGAMRSLVVDRELQNSLGTVAQERSAALSWDDGARAALSAIEEAAV